MELLKYTYRHPVTGKQVYEEKVWQDRTELFAVITLHSFNDAPAIVFENGDSRWYKDGLHHRDGDKPAVIEPGWKMWWVVDGKLHRLSGPAIDRPYRRVDYYINGEQYGKEEWEKHPDVVAYRLKQYSLK